MNENDIEKLIKDKKPEAPQNEKFKGVLRAQVLGELGRLNAQGKFNSNTFMNNVRYWLAGGVAVAIVVVAVLVSIPKQNNGSIALLSSGVNITHVSDKAFGNLSTVGAAGGTENSAAGTAANGAAPAAPVPATPPSGGANTASPMMSATVQSGGAGTSGSGVATPGHIIAQPVPPVYYQQQVKYVYKGDTFTQGQAQMDVLKYVTTPISAAQATAALENSGLGVFDLSSFNGMNLQNITLSEDQDFGYTVSIDLVGGTFSIYQNYAKWPQENNPKPLTQSDMPADSAVVAISDKFLSSHGFNMGNYGPGEVVQNNFGYPVPMMGAAGGAKTNAAAPNGIMRPYYPDTEAVLYPELINGRKVYDTSGNKIGLTVQVNIRYNRVSSVYGARIQNYQASSYDAITDTAEILSLAENPPFYPIVYMGVGASAGSGTSGSAESTKQVAEVDFGTPTLGYVQVFDYSNNQNNEYLVPAYVFPVTGGDQNYVYSKNIVVPLIRDFIQSRGWQIEPMMKGAPIPTEPPTPAQSAPNSK